ncbi:MAG TPA: hypothetical protein VF184_00880 [Phycisphaeraceae bacterium]
MLTIGRRRPEFDANWGQEMEAAARGVLGALTDRLILPQAAAVDAASLGCALDQFRLAGCRLLVIIQPTMGDCSLAAALAQQWPHPVMLWATPERPDADRVTACSLVGTHCFASILRQYGRSSEMLAADPRSPEASARLAAALRVAQAALRLREARIGLVGGAAPGFLNMLADPFELAAAIGAQLVVFGLEAFCNLVSQQEPDTVAADMQRVREIGLHLTDGLCDIALKMSSRYYLAIRQLMSQERLDALALRCWPELPERFGHWPYLAMARLASEGHIVALEGDVDGALTCLAGSSMGAGPGFITDWLEHDDHRATLWHPGHAAFELCERDSFSLGRHFNNHKPMVVNAALAAEQPVTLARIWRCDGRYWMTACHARTIRPSQRLAGTYGQITLDGHSPRRWLEHRCHQGMPHHLTMFPGHHLDNFQALARHLRLEWVQ